MKARFLLTLVAGAALFATSALSSAHTSPEVKQVAGARPGGPGGGRGNMMKMREEMYKKLHLTASQKKKLEAYDAHTMRAMQAAMKSNKGDRSAMRPMMQKMRDERGRFMKKTLTASQYKTYQAEEAKRQAERKARGGRMGGGPGGGRPGGPGAVK